MELLYTAHVPASSTPLPTVIALHGWGASAHDLLGLAPLLHQGRALVLAPQGPLTLQIAPGMQGYGWFPLAGGGPLALRELAAACEALDRFIGEAQSRYPIDPQKCVVLGFSQGGVLAYDLFLRNPERFAGLVALSSWFPAEQAERLPATPQAEQRPALVIHGTRDEMIAVERARESRTRLLERKLSLTYREYEMGHEIAPDALRELVDWLERKVFSPVPIV